MVLAIALFVVQSESFAQQGTLTDNASFPTTFSALTVQGSSATGGSADSFVKFKLPPNLPAGTPGSFVGKATLTLYVGSLTESGSINVYPVTSSWTEGDSTAPTYDTGNPVVTNVPVTAAGYVTIDLTALAQQWLGTDGLGAGGVPNYGIALVANTSTSAFSFDSKESTQTSHPAQLAIVLNHAATADNFTGTLAGDVTGTQTATVVSAVGGQSAADVASGTIAANAATTVNTPNTIVKRDASGGFEAGTITASSMNLPANGLKAGTNQLVLSGGNVGMGTIAPQSPLHIAKHFAPGETSSALYISDDNTSSGDNKGYLLRVDQQTTQWGPNHPQFVVRNGPGSGGPGKGPAVQVWDTFGVIPHANPPAVIPVGRTMVGIYTDESGDASILTMMNNINHVPFLEFRDNAINGTWDNGITRLKLSASGLLSFGRLVNTAPGLKPNGTTLAVRLGDDSGDAALSAGRATFSGNVGIGTTAPAGILDVGGLMTVQNVLQGRVGVGTNNPSYDLHIKKASNVVPYPRVMVEDTTDSKAIVIGVDSTKSSTVIDSTFGSGGSWPLNFRISGNDKMTLNTNGNVGIGTSTPQTKLQVNGGNVYIGSAGQGIVLKSPNGSVCKLLAIENTGAMVLSAITCP